MIKTNAENQGSVAQVAAEDGLVRLLRGLAFVALLAIISAAPTTAQQTITIRDAAFANVSSLTRICVDVMLRRAQNGVAFTSAGYTYRAEDRGVNQYGVHRGTGHYFDAPAGTAQAEVDAADRPAGICSVYTAHLSQAEVAAVVAAALRNFYPFAQQRDAANWRLSQNGQLPLLLSISTVGNNNRYQAPGTVRVSMSYPG